MLLTHDVHVIPVIFKQQNASGPSVASRWRIPVLGDKAVVSSMSSSINIHKWKCSKNRQAINSADSTQKQQS